jgi:hypothetical protein
VRGSIRSSACTAGQCSPLCSPGLLGVDQPGRPARSTSPDFLRTRGGCSVQRCKAVWCDHTS